MNIKQIAGILSFFVFTSCVTNRIKIDDVKNENRILKTNESYFTSAVPGLSQFINGEFIEGTLYLANIALGSYMYFNPSFMMSAKGNEKLTENDARIASISWASIWYLISYIDGVVTTYKRNDDYEKKLSVLINAQIEKKQKEQIKKNDEEKKLKIEQENESRLRLFNEEYRVENEKQYNYDYTMISDYKSPNPNFIRSVISNSELLRNEYLFDVRKIIQEEWESDIEYKNRKRAILEDSKFNLWYKSLNDLSSQYYFLDESNFNIVASTFDRENKSWNIELVSINPLIDFHNYVVLSIKNEIPTEIEDDFKLISEAIKNKKLKIAIPYSINYFYYPRIYSYNKMNEYLVKYFNNIPDNEKVYKLALEIENEKLPSFDYERFKDQSIKKNYSNFYDQFSNAFNNDLLWLKTETFEEPIYKIQLCDSINIMGISCVFSDVESDWYERNRHFTTALIITNDEIKIQKRFFYENELK